jgi:SM-20-related protein
MVWDKLTDWIADPHLEKENIDKYREILCQLHGILVIDDFLHEERAHSLRLALEGDIVFEQKYSHFRKRERVSKRVSKEEWLSSCKKERFFTHLEAIGPKLGKELSIQFLNHLFFCKILGSSAFCNYFGRVCGRSLSGLQRINGKILRKEHFLRPHSDNTPGRALCASYYLSIDWKKEYGGELYLYDKGKVESIIDPLFNRLVLFNPSQSSVHGVGPMNLEVSDWPRYNYSFWFRQQDDSE